MKKVFVTIGLCLLVTISYSQDKTPKKIQKKTESSKEKIENKTDTISRKLDKKTDSAVKKVYPKAHKVKN